MLAPPELTEPLGLSAAKILGSCACAGGDSAKHASTSEMTRKPRRKGDLLAEYLTGGLVVLN
jgi:hypothetical protein